MCSCTRQLRVAQLKPIGPRPNLGKCSLLLNFKCLSHCMDSARLFLALVLVSTLVLYTLVTENTSGAAPHECV